MIGDLRKSTLGDSVLIKVKTGQKLADACLIPNSVIHLDPLITYTVPNTINIEDNITINGNGATVTIGNNDTIFNCIDSAKLAFNNIHFVANSNARTVAGGLTAQEKEDGTLFIISATAIECRNVKGLNVSDCNFKGFRGGAVRIGGIGGGSNWDRLTKIYDCQFTECAVGIVAHEDAEYGTITNCDFNTCGWGIIHNAGNWVLENIKVNYSANGIWNVSEDTFVSNATGNFLHGAMSNLQLNHSNSSVVFPVGVQMQVGGINYANYGLFHKGVLIPSLVNLVIYESRIFYEDGDRPWKIVGGTFQGVNITTELINNIVLHNVDLRGGNNLGNATIGGFDESLRTGMIAYSGMSLPVVDELTVTISARTMRFIDLLLGTEVIITKPEVDFEFTDGLNALDDLGVVHFYEDVNGVIFGSAKTDWSTPEQRIRYVYLGNADVNGTKDGFLQANNPIVSAYGLLNAFGDYLAIGGSIKAHGGKISANNLGLDIGGYTAVAWGRNFDQEIPHTPTSADIVLADLHLGYRTSDISMFFGGIVSDIDPTKYQRIEDITLSTVPTEKYTIQRVYQYPGTTYNMVLYGSTLYDNLDQAILNASTERYNLHPSIVPACFLAYIIVRQDVTNLETAITNKTAAILNYDGRSHPSTIGAESSPALSLEAGGKLRSMRDQFVDVTTAPVPNPPHITYIEFEIGKDSLYGCEWDSVIWEGGTCSDPQYITQATCEEASARTLKNTSQKDIIANIEAQVGRRSTSNNTELELFTDVSYNDGVDWNVDINDSYATVTSLPNQAETTSISALTYRIVPNAMIRVGMIITSAVGEVGVIVKGVGTTQPPDSLSGRNLPSCELVIT